MDIFIQIFMIRCGASGNGALFGMVSVRIVLRKNRKKPSFRYVLAAGKRCRPPEGNFLWCLRKSDGAPRHDRSARFMSGLAWFFTVPLRFKKDANARRARPEPICPDRPNLTISFQKIVEEATLGLAGKAL